MKPIHHMINKWLKPAITLNTVNRAREGRLEVRLHAEVNLVNFFFPSHFRGCRPRIACRGWVERVGAVCMCSPGNRYFFGAKDRAYPTPAGRFEQGRSA